LVNKGSEQKWLSRRSFLSKGIASAGSLSLLSGIIGNSALARTVRTGNLNLSSLQGKFKGLLLTSKDADFNKIVLGGLWNELRPTRMPQLVAQVSDEQDIVQVIKYARANKLKVSVRGGGHNWCSPSNRNGGILIDLTNLNKVISIDAGARKAVVQPIVSNREVQAALKPYDLAFPSGHCPPVKMSGYLLSGGMSWNQGVWGPAVSSVEAIELVTPDGELITANANQNQDYFWAARGGSCGLFAVATRYHLRLYPLPKAIATSLYYYPYENMEDVCKWLGPLARQLPKNVELSFGILTAPPELADKCTASNGKLCCVSATLFADDEAEVHAALSLLDSCPVIDKCLSKSVEQPSNFEALFDASGALWPSGQRCRTDALFYDCALTDVAKAVKDHFLTTPSAKSLIFISVFTGKNVPVPTPQDAAFSMTGNLYGGPWTMWEKSADDNENKHWHEKCVQLLKPHIRGHYVAETNTVEHPDFAKASYKEANWQRLAQLRKKYDPEGVFFDFSSGLT
jgi:FAD binding domain